MPKVRVLASQDRPMTMEPEHRDKVAASECSICSRTWFNHRGGMVDDPRPLELLGKHLGLFIDRSEVTHSGHVSQGEEGLQATIVLVAQVAAERNSGPNTN